MVNFPVGLTLTGSGSGSGSTGSGSSGSSTNSSSSSDSIGSSIGSLIASGSLISNMSVRAGRGFLITLGIVIGSSTASTDSSAFKLPITSSIIVGSGMSSTISKLIRGFLEGIFIIIYR